ncbi:MAG: sigma-70 family RNA polymerase sigma factor [Thermoanaerobaculia bacterium]|nr:sigma-70 family RNA polymerase sigma factor [Thermoanaerobaculia bacterium]
MSLRNYSSSERKFAVPSAPPPDYPDEASRIRARDPDALRDAVRANLRDLLKAARGAGLDQQQAEEAVQETFRTFVETAERFEGRSKVRTWLFGILYRKLSEARRALGRERRFEGLDELTEEVFNQRFGADGRWSSPPVTPAEEFERRELRREIAQCLEASPLPQRMAFVLREVHGLETDEICEILEVDRNYLGVMLYRLRIRTRDCLESKGLGLQGSRIGERS